MTRGSVIDVGRELQGTGIRGWPEQWNGGRVVGGEREGCHGEGMGTMDVGGG